MSEVKNINEALSQLYENLKELESARDHVNEVIGKNTEFTNATNNLVSGLGKLSKLIENKSDATIESFDNTINSLESKFEDTLSDIKSKISESIIEISKNFNIDTSSVVSKFSEKIILIQTQIDDLQKVSIEVIEKVKNENLKTLSDIKQSNKQTRNLLDSLQKLEFTKQLSEIRNESQVRSKKLISFLTIILGIVSIEAICIITILIKIFL